MTRKKTLAVLVAVAAIGGGTSYVAHVTRVATAPARDDSWRKHPLVSRILDDQWGRPFRWDGKIERKTESPSEEEKKVLCEKRDKQMKGEAASSHDEATKKENLALLTKVWDQRLNGVTTVTDFTLQSNGTEYLLTRQDRDEKNAFVTVVKSGYTDSSCIGPSQANLSPAVERHLPGIYPYDFGKLDFILGLQRMAELYETTKVTGDASRCCVTFGNGADDPGALQEDSLTYDASVSTLFPVSWTKAAGGTVNNATTITLAQPDGAVTPIPVQISTVYYIHGKQVSATTVTVERVDYQMFQDIDALTPWPSRAYVNDYRFSTKGTVQYPYRPGMTEAEILQKARAQLGPFVRRLDAR